MSWEEYQLSENFIHPCSEVCGLEGGVEETPVFQLENLENLQLVLPELGEPQIVIPETGT